MSLSVGCNRCRPWVSSFRCPSGPRVKLLLRVWTSARVAPYHDGDRRCALEQQENEYRVDICVPYARSVIGGSIWLVGPWECMKPPHLAPFHGVVGSGRLCEKPPATANSTCYKPFLPALSRLSLSALALCNSPHRPSSKSSANQGIVPRLTRPSFSTSHSELQQPEPCRRAGRIQGCLLSNPVCVLLR